MDPALAELLKAQQISLQDDDDPAMEDPSEFYENVDDAAKAEKELELKRQRAQAAASVNAAAALAAAQQQAPAAPRQVDAQLLAPVGPLPAVRVEEDEGLGPVMDVDAAPPADRKEKRPIKNKKDPIIGARSIPIDNWCGRRDKHNKETPLITLTKLALRPSIIPGLYLDPVQAAPAEAHSAVSPGGG